MLRKHLYFIHEFDAKVHYALHYSLLKFQEDDGIYLNDSVLQKKCKHRLGRWNFMVGDRDYSCGVYHSLEVIRQSIFSAIKNNKKSANISLVSIKNDGDICEIINGEQGFKSLGDKKQGALLDGHSVNCESDRQISKQLFLKVIKPILKEMFEGKDHKRKLFKNKLNERSYQIKVNFNQDLDILRMEWDIDPLNDSIFKPAAKELQLIA